MDLKKKLLTSVVLISFLAFGMLGSADAYSFYIDSFSTTKNSTTIFEDEFDDGNPPPSAPNWITGQSASYYVSGVMGPESGSKLALNKSGAIIIPGVSGGPYFYQQAILASSINPTTPEYGFRTDDTFSVTAVFDLIAPALPREAYGVRFSDSTPSNVGNDLATLLVLMDSLNNLKISYLEIDVTASTVNALEEALLDSTHDQIALSLTRADTTSNDITASYAYIDGGSWGSWQQFSATSSIFDGEDYTRAAFTAQSPVPEPTTMLLLGSGLVGLAAFRRRFRR